MAEDMDELVQVFLFGTGHATEHFPGADLASQQGEGLHGPGQGEYGLGHIPYFQKKYKLQRPGIHPSVDHRKVRLAAEGIFPAGFPAVDFQLADGFLTELDGFIDRTYKGAVVIEEHGCKVVGEKTGALKGKSGGHGGFPGAGFPQDHDAPFIVDEAAGVEVDDSALVKQSCQHITVQVEVNHVRISSWYRAYIQFSATRSIERGDTVGDHFKFFGMDPPFVIDEKRGVYLAAMVHHPDGDPRKRIEGRLQVIRHYLARIRWIQK